MQKISSKSAMMRTPEFEEAWNIERKLLNESDSLAEEEVMFIKAKAEQGSPLGEFVYGLYFLVIEHDEKTAEEWWNKFFYHANGFTLWEASEVFASLGDIYQDWSIKCLRRSAWKQFKLAKMKIASMK